MSGPALRQTLSSCQKQATCSAQHPQLSFAGALAAILREGNPLAYQSSAGPYGSGSTFSSRSASFCFNAACDSGDQQEMSCSHQHSSCLLKNRLSEGAPDALRGMQIGQGMQAIAQPAQGVPHHPLRCSQGNSNTIHSLQPGLPAMPCHPAEPSCEPPLAQPSSPPLELQRHWRHQPLAPSLLFWPYRGAQIQNIKHLHGAVHAHHAQKHGQTRLFQANAPAAMTALGHVQRPNSQAATAGMSAKVLAQQGQTRPFQAIAAAAMTSPGHKQPPVRQAATAGLSAKALVQQGQMDKAVALLRLQVAGTGTVAAKDSQAVIAALCQAGQAQVGLHCSSLMQGVYCVFLWTCVRQSCPAAQ